MSVYVSIGRNIGSEPMSAERWRDFRESTDATVRTLAGPLASATDGIGWWDDQPEETHLVVGAAEYYDLKRNTALADLYSRLTQLARQFGQASIVLAVTEPTFVAAAGMTDDAEERLIAELRKMRDEDATS